MDLDSLKKPLDANEGILDVFHNPYIRKKIDGNLGVKQIRIGERDYYVITERPSDVCKNRTFVPLRWGKNILSEYDVLDLYAGKSLKLGKTDSDNTTGYFITPASYNVQVERVGKDFHGSYFMNLATIFPCYNKETGEIEGYICQNIYFPNSIQTDGITWTINECETASLAHHGKIIDDTNARSVVIEHFEEVKNQAAKSEKAIFVQFAAVEYGENINAKHTRKIRRMG